MTVLLKNPQGMLFTHLLFWINIYTSAVITISTNTCNLIFKKTKTMSIRDNLKTQLEEIEMIKSVFFQPGEFREDRDSFAAVRAYVSEGYILTTPPLVFTVNLIIDKVHLEVSVTLQASYPTERPSLYLRNRCASGTIDISRLDQELKEFMSSLEKGEICVWQSIMWLQENTTKYYKETKAANRTTSEKTLSRYWILSHHIYSSKKKKSILDLAAKNGITGFMLPGKPGLICLEGTEDECHDAWFNIRNMNWQKITLKLEEKDCTHPRKFSTFETLHFEGHSDKHMDMGKFLIFLREHNCEYVFKEYFGCDGQSANNS